MIRALLSCCALLVLLLSPETAAGAGRTGPAVQHPPPVRAANIDEPTSGTPMNFMLNAIREDARDTAEYTGQAEISTPVLDAMGRVPRDEFVPPGAAHLAYFNRPLGIGHGQTISQPFIVALMTDLLAPQTHHRVLEIGTGSGYQAAVLSLLVAKVFTIEIIPELAATAAATLERLGYANTEVRSGDGWYGWPEQAQFDSIIVTAVAPEIPPRLIEQLKPGGRLVMPLGRPRGMEMLVVVRKDRDGTLHQRDVLPVRFVPLTGDHDD